MNLTDDEIKRRIICAAVTNINECGYRDCTTENVKNNFTYNSFFQIMLRQFKTNDIKIKQIISNLLVELESIKF